MPPPISTTMTSSSFRIAVFLAGAPLLAACASAPRGEPAPADAGPRTVQPGAPGEETRSLDSAEVAELTDPGYSAADVRFMRGMIPHHAQALVMTDLVAERTERRGIRLLAQRIAISQRDEIALMERWLEARGESPPRNVGPAARGEEGAHLMPGMLTAAELDRLKAARGAEFDRLFLELMIRHHAGALTMVETLFSSPGGGQESAIYQFASDVSADQQMEIDRMRRMLSQIP